MTTYFADLHIHIGRTITGKPVKISASNHLTFTNILETAVQEKGLDMIGIIDCHSPEVLYEIEQLIDRGEAEELSGGGISYRGTTVILGSEVEIKDEGYQPVHYLCYFPTLERMKHFSAWLGQRVKNIHLSSQRVYSSSYELQQKVKELEGIFIPAHIFTPYKGIYGSAVERMEEILHLEWIDGVELGLSGNSDMADTIAELKPFTFLTNSDAHSLGKIAREYQQIKMKDNSFAELKQALHRNVENKVVANYGLSPKLGKYHISVCLQCEKPLERYQPSCPDCGGNVLKGVYHRIKELASYTETIHPNHRPPYIEHVPLDFLPGIGKATYNKMLNMYKTEMNILHRVPIEQIREDFGNTIADLIKGSREGTLQQISGGGGTYGKIKNKSAQSTLP